MEDEFGPLDNTLIKNKYKKVTHIGSKPKIEHFINNFKVDDDNKGLLMHIEKIMVSRNGEWAYDTYIRANNTIDKKAVKRYITKLENEYEVEDIGYHFHGGPPMGTVMLDYNEIQGENVWVVNLKPKLYEYLKKNGTVGDLEDKYNQLGGENNHDKFRLIHDKYKLGPTDTLISRLGKIVGNEAHKINSLIIDTINDIFFVEGNDEKKDPAFYKPIKQVNTLFNGYSYYTFLNVYKDGKFMDKVKIESRQNPIEWQFVVNKILELNKNPKFYGYVYKLTNSFDKGLILETTDDERYKVDYKYDD
jgi:hypothetical protein